MHDVSEQAPAQPGVQRRPLIRIRILEGVTAVAAVALVVLVGREGTIGWRVVRAVLVGAASFGLLVLMTRLGPRVRGVSAVLFGIVCTTIGIGFLPFLSKTGISPTSVAAVVLTLSGLVLVAGGIVETARGHGALVGVVVGLAAGVVALVLTVLAALVFSPAVAVTNVPRSPVGATPDSVGLDHESVRLHTPDGVELAGWYVPSSGGAAVVLLPGAGSTRSSVLPHAEVLAGNGYGVLMVDPRGHGDSGGRAMDFGWHGDEDVAAATAFLRDRSDVDPDRIGIVGISMGGEEAVGATAADPSLRAVVAEGATARNAEDDAWLSEVYGVRGMLQERLEGLQDWMTDALTNASVPVGLRAAIESSDARYLLITAESDPEESSAAAHMAAAAPGRVEVWTVPGAGHASGLDTAPDEWEQRVVTFLDHALAVR